MTNLWIDSNPLSLEDLGCAIKANLYEDVMVLKEQLLEANAKIDRLMGVLVNVKNCPDSDLTTYCMSVDSMVCIALAEIKEGE
jgi:hypothetical protein